MNPHLPSPSHRCDWPRGGVALPRSAPLLAVLLCVALGAAAAVAATVELPGVSGEVPAAWRPQPPATAMRAAQFDAGGAHGAATAAVFFFGPGQGGGAAENIARWRSQFSAPGGGAVEPVVTTLQVAGMPVTRVTLEGVYSRAVGMGPVGQARTGQALLAAVVEGPGGNLYFQLWGDAAAVSAATPDFDRFVRSLVPATAGR